MGDVERYSLFQRKRSESTSNRKESLLSILKCILENIFGSTSFLEYNLKCIGYANIQGIKF